MNKDSSKVVNNYSLKPYCLLPYHFDLVNTITRLQNQRMAITLDKKPTIEIWSIITNQRTTIITVNVPRIDVIIEIPYYSFAFSYKATLSILNYPNYNSAINLIGHKDKVTCLLYLKNGQLASSSNDCTIKLWNILTYQCVVTLGLNEKDRTAIYSLYELSTGRLASDYCYQGIKLWHPPKIDSVYTIWDNIRSDINVIELKDGRLVSSNIDKTIKVWKKASYVSKEAYVIDFTLKGHNDYVMQLVLLNDNNRIVSGDRSQIIKVWDIKTKKCIKTLNNEKILISLIESNNGQALVLTESGIMLLDV